MRDKFRSANFPCQSGYKWALSPIQLPKSFNVLPSSKAKYNKVPLQLDRVSRTFNQMTSFLALSGGTSAQG